MGQKIITVYNRQTGRLRRVGQVDGGRIRNVEETTTARSSSCHGRVCRIYEKVIACMALTNRESQNDDSVQVKVAKRNIDYFSLSSAKPLLRHIIQTTPSPLPQLTQELEKLR